MESTKNIIVLSLIDNEERIVEESRIQNVSSSMTTIKISKRSLSNFDDKRFYVNNIKSYPLDENMYLFKRDLVNKICEGASPLVPQAGSLINNTNLELLIKLGLDVSKELHLTLITDLGTS